MPKCVIIENMFSRKTQNALAISSNACFLSSLGLSLAFFILYLLLPGSNPLSITFAVIAFSGQLIFLVVYFLFSLNKPGWVLETLIVQYILIAIVLLLLLFVYSWGFALSAIGSALNSSSSSGAEEVEKLSGVSGFFLFYVFSMVIYLLSGLLFLISIGVCLEKNLHLSLFRFGYILFEVASIILAISLFYLLSESNLSENPLPYLFISIACSSLGVSLRLEEAFKTKKAPQLEPESQK